MTVLLVANYVPDRQESMQRFAALFERVLPLHDVRVESIRPEPRFNRQRTATGWGKYFGYLDKLVWFPRRLRRRVRELRGCVVHICDHSNAFYTRVLRGTPHLVTCHDLLAIRAARGEFPQNETRWSGRRLQELIVGGLNEAQKIVCVSEATRRDLLRVTAARPECAEVIYNGLNYDYRAVPRKESAAVLRNVPLPARFVLLVGGNHWYKNRPGALEIYSCLRQLDPDAPKLVVAGADFTREQREMVRALSLEPHVNVIPHPSNQELRALYSTAELLLFPSFAEGFGWPIIEAQACGCPVVTSNRPPMNEIAGAAAEYIDPADPAGAAQRVAALLRESEAARALRAAQSIANAARFSTDEMAAAYVRAYRSLAPGKIASGARSGVFPAVNAGNAPIQTRGALR